MKTMKTCKVGCGKIKAGGPIKKVKKMAKGGAADYNYGIPLNGLPMRPTNGNTDISKNQMGTNPTMKKGGTIKKMQNGGPKSVFKPVAKSNQPKPKGYNDNLVPSNPISTPTKKIKKMAKGGFPDLNEDGKVTKADILKGRGVFKKGGTKKYQAGGNTGENPNPSGKSIGKQAGVFGGALAALVGLTREKGIERRAKKAEERYDKRQVKKQVKAEIKEAKNMPKSKMGGMTKSKKK